MNLHDVVKLMPQPKFSAAGVERQVEAASRIQVYMDQLDAMQDDPSLGLGYNQRQAVGVVGASVAESLSRHKAELLRTKNSLPKELITKDALSLAAISPKMSMSEIRKLTDTLEFVFMPLGYTTAQGQADYTEQRAIEKFVKKTTGVYAPYVLCPINLYSIERHLDSDELPIYAAKAHQAAFSAIEMTLPLFRVMRAEIKSLDSRMNALELKIKNVEKEITNLSQKVNQLAAQVEANHRAFLEEKVASEAQRRRIEQMDRIVAIDPLLIGVPLIDKKVDLMKNATCLVGPCWGPDFDDIVLTLLGLKKVQGQRKSLHEAALKWSYN